LARLGPSSDHRAVDGSRTAAASTSEANLPIGRLEIPRIGLSAVVMEGGDEQTLNVAVGHLPDTPLPWQPGNAALAGHRDTFFRPLRRIRDGDEIRLVTPRGTFRYRTTRQVVVEPDELWVLDPSPAAALTLITCYPFDFVGAAPRRFVVQAERIVETNEARDLSADEREGGV
jgi:sortase A